MNTAQMQTAYMNPAQATTAVPALPALPAAPRRLDIYAPIHKAIRAEMCQTLVALGRMDADDAADLSATLDRLEQLLTLCSNHLAHENDFVHPAIEARQPGGAQRIAGEHREHQQTLAALSSASAQLRRQPDGAGALRLYRQVALFMADIFFHMHEEESQHNALLWAHHSDAQIAAIEQRLQQSIPPAELAHTLGLLATALSPAERAQLFGQIQRDAPPAALQGLLDSVRPRLDDRSWAKLARALGLPPVPGLVTV